jgi:hypothetical protein
MYSFVRVYTVLIKHAEDKASAAAVRFGINLLKPRLDFVQDPAPLISLPDGSAAPPQWLEYEYRMAHPALRWLPTKLAE